MPSIQDAFNWAIERCNAPNVGYSQEYRNERTVNGITYYDCSSFIWYALKAGDFDVVAANGGSTWPFTTYTMPAALRLLGFTQQPKTQPWTPGDILLRTDHTEMAFDGNHTMGAHSSRVPLAEQVSILSNPSQPGSWLQLWRYGGGASTEWIKGNRYLSMGEMQNNAGIVYTTLLSRGWSAEAISGMLGNMEYESTINPGIWEDLTPNPFNGWGLVQWTPSTKYTNWAVGRGYAVDDGDAQLKWLDEEMVRSGEWIPTEQYPQSFSDFKTSTDAPEFLAYVFLNNFERPYNPDQPERMTAAAYWYSWYLGNYVPPPNPNPEPGWTSKMPIWFYLKKW